MRMIEIRDLHVTADGKEILKGVNLTISQGEVHAIMGPNGSGKSTLANVLMGHPKYAVTSGHILLDGEDITDWPADARAKKGLFLSFQYPVEIPGVTVESFLRTAVNSVHRKNYDVVQFHKMLKEKMQIFRMDEGFSRRYLNEGFSGGEKKRMEILQMLMLDPKFAVLDETDSGLDVDALRIVAEGINNVRDKDHGVIIITHYNRILQYVTPDHVHILLDGRIARSGGKELAQEIEENGYGPSA
jgi:Fe-S cluster assembly ATP-binding protein